jgi:hypothetical protein
LRNEKSTLELSTSLFFWGWLASRYAGLLLVSIALNYAAGYLIGHSAARQSVKFAAGRGDCHQSHFDWTIKLSNFTALPHPVCSSYFMQVPKDISE